jgi:predicted DNA binding CopG/RHH family protein
MTHFQAAGAVEAAMKRRHIPKTDSITKLADFWQGHDLTDYEDELEEVAEPVFEQRATPNVTLRLGSRQAVAVQRIARAHGIACAQLVRTWIAERIRRETKGGQARQEVRRGA